MKTFGRAVGITLLVLILLFVAAALVLPHIIKPDAYKARIVALVQEKTGRTLTISGHIGLSFFPWIGVRLQQVALSNPPGFPSGTFASIRSAGIRVRLLPLLRKRVEIDEIRLNGLQAALLRTRAGATNWADLTGAPSSRKQSPSATPAPGSSPLVQALTVAGVRIQNANATFTDEQTGQRLGLRDFQLTTGRVLAAHAVPLSFSGVLQAAKPQVSTHLTGSADLVFEPAHHELGVQRLHLRALGVVLEGNLSVVLAPTLGFHGALSVPATDLRAALARLAIHPQMRDPKALTSVALQLGVAGSPTSLSVNPLQVTLDGSHLTGTASWRRQAGGSAETLALSIDQIDLDRYLAPPAAKGSAPPAPGAAPAPAPPVPLKLLRTLNVDGNLAIGRLTVSGVHTQNAHLGLAAHAGLIRLTPLRAQLYGGTVAGDLTYDARPATPRITATANLAHVSLGPLLTDAKVFDKFSGTATVRTHLTAEGLAAPGLTKTLNGNVAIALANGQIRGVNLTKIISDAQALYDRLRGQATVVTPSAGDHTNFATLTATAVIRNGVAQNNDLVLGAPPYLGATGKGDVDLASKEIHYELRVTAKNPQGRALTMPVVVSGPFSKMSYKVDLAAAIRAREQNRINTERQKLKSRLQQELNRKLRSLLP